MRLCTYVTSSSSILEYVVDCQDKWDEIPHILQVSQMLIAFLAKSCQFLIRSGLPNVICLVAESMVQQAPKGSVMLGKSWPHRTLYRTGMS